MRNREGHFRSRDGLDLYCQSWHPDAASKAVLAITHGHGEHSGRYQNIVGYFVPRGFTAYAYDLRGHGRSPGRRGNIRSWEDFRQDQGSFLEFVSQQEPGLPLFAYGHSLGGLIVLDFILRSPAGLRGAVVSAPVLGPPGIPPLLLTLSRVLSRMLPSLTMSTGLDATGLSRDPAVVRAYREDPLVHGKANARLGTELIETTEWVQSHAADLRIPLLVVQGELDRITRPSDTRRFVEHLTFSDTQHIEYVGGFHEPHNDIEHERVMADVEAWLTRHL
ncbi:MAG: lysophospholipase [Chloroflexota bacterium]